MLPHRRGQQRVECAEQVETRVPSVAGETRIQYTEYCDPVGLRRHTMRFRDLGISYPKNPARLAHRRRLQSVLAPARRLNCGG